VQKGKAVTRRVCCVGEVMIELSNALGGTPQLGVAGDTYNTAVYLGRLLRGSPIEISYVTALGKDPYSSKIEHALKDHGLDVSLVETRPDLMPGLYAIDTDEFGERSFSYWRSNSAARSLFSEPCSVSPSDMLGADLIYLSGITMAILPSKVRQRLIDFIAEFRSRGGVFAYDSNYRPRLWESRGIAQDINEQMWRAADIALPSVDDEMELFGDRDEAAVLARLSRFGVSQGALKRGAEGPLDLSGVASPQDLQAVSKVVDSTAAGDSFNAGYLAAYLKGETTQIALETGHNLAAKVISARGAIIPE